MTDREELIRDLQIVQERAADREMFGAASENLSRVLADALDLSEEERREVLGEK